MIHILGGGTFSHVRSHLALAAPAFGETAKRIENIIVRRLIAENDQTAIDQVTLHLTRMAHPENRFAPVTNEDVAVLVDRLIADPATKMIFFNMALCDFDGEMIDPGMQPNKNRTPEYSGKYAERLKTREYDRYPARMALYPSDKLIGRIRRDRKDIFLIGFKTTTNATPDEQYLAGLNLLKANSVNLVLANDTGTRNNMIIAPEETRYSETTDRDAVLEALVDMAMARSSNTFTRSTVVDGVLYPFDTAPEIPETLRRVVQHLVARGAYKPFRGATAGHFAVKLDDGSCLTSRRKTDYTKPGGLDLVEIEYTGFDKVVAYGAKPSVGGQSQRIVFDENPDFDCIVHAHIPMRDDAPDAVPVAEQAPYECGSHQCGANTSRNLVAFGNIKAVMLDRHGPNIVFGRNAAPEDVIDFIERNFDVLAKTGGLVTPGLVAEPVA